MFKYKPDYEQAQRRTNAFWNHEELERPLVWMKFPKADAKDFPVKNHDTFEDYWLDIEYRAEKGAHDMENMVFYAESMPVAYPNMGPEILAAFAGCSYNYTETTTWAEPCVFDWKSDKAVIDMKHPLAKKLEDFTSMLLEKARGNFIVGLTDLHPGGDHLAALRDPQNLAMDLLECPEMIVEKLQTSYKEFYAVYDYYVNLLKNEKMPITTWLPITSETTMYIPSNDFSCMISNEMFVEFFLDGIVNECRHYAESIYHLDGPGALRHLDSLLEISELNAIQWVPGAGREDCTNWLDVYKKILSAGKSLIVYPRNMEDLRFLMEHLPAKGVCVQIWPIQKEEEAQNLMQLINKWPRRKVY